MMYHFEYVDKYGNDIDNFIIEAETQGEAQIKLRNYINLQYNKKEAERIIAKSHFLTSTNSCIQIGQSFD